jgi:hypothetical protein
LPDTRTHRGAHPEDARLFDPEVWPALRLATADLSWLLSHGYASTSALKLVGDRHKLAARQRIAVARSACSDFARRDRLGRQVDLSRLRGETLWLDGYNVLTTIEAALAGGVILAARDGCYRDMASVHGTYRKVEETVPALGLVGRWTSALGVAACRWYLDRPVSNSGRLKRIMLDAADAEHWDWQVELAFNPDAVLAATDAVVATADSVVLDRCGRWVNLARQIVAAEVPSARIVELEEVRSEE